MENLLKMIKATSYDNYVQNGIYTFINPFSYLSIRKLKILQNFDYIYIDGILLVKLFSLFKIHVTRKSFDMTSLAPVIFNDSIENNKSIYFIGSTEDAIYNFINVINKEFPELNIVGHRNGYFNNVNDKEKALKDILQLEPNIVIVGMGTPYQEQFLVDLKSGGWKGTGYTCGGFIHQTAQGINYYPKFYNKYNLRWLYRIIDEPKLIKRYTILYPKAIFLFFLDYINYRMKHQK